MAKKKNAESNGVAVMEPATQEAIDELAEELGQLDIVKDAEAELAAREQADDETEDNETENETTEADDAATVKPEPLSIEDMDPDFIEKRSAEYREKNGIPDFFAAEQEGIEAIEWQKRVREKGQEVARLKTEIGRAAQMNKDVKKALKTSLNELQVLVCREPKALPLIDGAKARAAEVAKVDRPDESWRDVAIDILGDLPDTTKSLTAKQVENLAEQGITTIGKLADYSNRGKHLTDLKGFGPAGVEKLEEASMSFHATWANTKAQAAKQSDVIDVETRDAEPGYWNFYEPTTDGASRYVGSFTGTFADAQADAKRISDAEGFEIEINKEDDKFAEDDDDEPGYWQFYAPTTDGASRYVGFCAGTEEEAIEAAAEITQAQGITIEIVGAVTPPSDYPNDSADLDPAEADDEDDYPDKDNGFETL
jgi:hypothetical protein